MTIPNHENFGFLPRPEAHAMRLDDLMPPVQRAVIGLLDRIANSESARAKNAKENDGTVSNCFLIYGARGTGKTTVLLTAQNAVCRENRETTFKPTAYGNVLREPWKNLTADDLATLKSRYGNSLGNIVWLDMLDLEPLPLEANLLATLLIRIRDALGSPACNPKETKLRSIFEEDKDSAHQQFTRLIDDATLAWENIREQDTRNRASRQIAASEIFAKFRERFNSAMGKLSEELARHHGGNAKHYSIVLPIDNIDRCSEHLHSIFKFAPMLSNRHLWLVMAGDRENIDTFLERGYWKELIYSNVGISAMGKRGPDGEDEAFIMARHQAAAASQKLLPTSHRIDIDLMKAKYTLRFFPPDQSSTSHQPSLWQLFNEINVPTTQNQREKKENSEGLKLIDWFDISQKIQTRNINEQASAASSIVEVQQETLSVLTPTSEFLLVEERVISHSPPSEKPTLTRIAEHALCLPARGVLDLWHLTCWMINKRSREITQGDSDYEAEKIIRTMLRNAIAESKMPNTRAQLLQGTIRRTNKGGTFLSFLETELETQALSALDFETQLIKPITKNPVYAIRSRLTVEIFEDLILLLNRPDSTSQTNEKTGNSYPQPFVITTNKEYFPELPPLVAAWLMILHDILLLVDPDDEIQLAVCSYIKKRPAIVNVNHEIVYSSPFRQKTELKFLSWLEPEWGTYLAHEIFRERWWKFQQAIKKLSNKPELEEILPRLLSASWIACILETYIAFNPPGPDKKHFSSDKWGQACHLISAIELWEQPLKQISETREHLDSSEIARWAEGFDMSVMIAAAKLHSCISYWLFDFTENDRLENLELGSEMKNWLEQHLPLLLLDAYVPMKEPIGKNRRAQIKKHLMECSEGHELMAIWKDNWPFIIADLKDKLAKRFEVKEATEEEKDSQNKPNRLAYLATIEQFKDFDELWNA